MLAKMENKTARCSWMNETYQCICLMFPFEHSVKQQRWIWRTPTGPAFMIGFWAMVKWRLSSPKHDVCFLSPTAVYMLFNFSRRLYIAAMSQVQSAGFRMHWLVIVVCWQAIIPVFPASCFRAISVTGSFSGTPLKHLFIGCHNWFECIEHHQQAAFFFGYLIWSPLGTLVKPVAVYNIHPSWLVLEQKKFWAFCRLEAPIISRSAILAALVSFQILQSRTSSSSLAQQLALQSSQLPGCLCFFCWVRHGKQRSLVNGSTCFVPAGFAAVAGSLRTAIPSIRL